MHNDIPVLRIHLVPYNSVLIRSADTSGGSDGCRLMDNSEQYSLAGSSGNRITETHVTNIIVCHQTLQ